MKLVTYNIQYTKGKDYRYEVDRIVEAVKGADVIALQEVERFWKRSGMTDQPAEIAKRLPNYYWIYTPPFDMDASQKQNNGTILNRRRQFGTMILSKKPILSSLADGLGMGIGFTLSLAALGAVREVLGSGTFFGSTVFGPSFQPFSFMVEAPGAFVCLGLMLCIMNLFGKK